MGITLKGEIIEVSGMWTSRIYQKGNDFIFETQSEMMAEPHVDTFTNLQGALNEMYSRT